MKLRWLAAFTLAMSLVACGTGSTASDDDASEESANSDAFAASPATRAELGVVEWSSSTSTITGYDADGRPAFLVQWRVTKATDARDLFEVYVRASDGVSHVARTVDKKEGAVMFSDVERKVANPEAFKRALALLGQDLKTAAASSSSTGIRSTSLRFNSPLVGGTPPLVRPCDPFSGAWPTGYTDHLGNNWLIESVMQPDGTWVSAPC